jgi:hypothetical protein
MELQVVKQKIANLTRNNHRYLQSPLTQVASLLAQMELLNILIQAVFMIQDQQMILGII